MNPFAHQEEIVERTWNRPGFAFFWEPRVGKSLPQVLTALRLRDAGLIDCMVILAPQGVHHGWARDVIPQAITYHGQFEHQILDWMSNQAGTARFITKAESVLKNTNMVFICADSNGLTSQRLRDYLEKAVKQRKCLLVLDEGHFFKNPQAQRTKFVIKLAKKCPYRRDLTGTPLTSPFDLWSQMQIIDPAILNERFVPFKTRYGIFETKFFGPRAVKVVSGYKELPELKARIEPHCSWLTLKDVFPNLPDILPPERAYFEISPEQRRAYEELKKEYILQLERGEVLINNPLVMILRLSQIARGFVTTDNGNQVIPGHNAALTRLMHEISERPDEKIVIWCRFTEDVNTVLAELAHQNIKAVRLDGQVDQEHRLENMSLFQNDPSVRVIVGTPSTGGVGVDLSAGSTVIFYSHGFNLIERLQAMSRVRGVNQKNKISQIDMVAVDTVDERCMSLLEARVDVVSRIQDRGTLLHVLKDDHGADFTLGASVDVSDAVFPEDVAADVLERMIEGK